MITNKLFIYTAIVFLLIGNSAFGQEEERYNQYIMAHVVEDSILLRWAPANYETWKQGIKQGYTIERHTLYSNGSMLPASMRKKKIFGPITPYDEEQWVALMDKDDYAAIAAEAMYGESFELDAGDDTDILRMFDIATEQQNRFSFALFAADMSAKAAKASALFYTDKNVISGEKYLYRIYVNSNDTIPKDSSYVFTGPDEVIPLSKPIIEDVAADDKMAVISWQIPPSRNEYTAYFIERSDDNGASFYPINDLPLINFKEEGKRIGLGYYIDTLPQNDTKYIYRLKGISPFGINGPYSDTVSTQGIARVRAIPQITQHNIDGPVVNLIWEFPEKELKKIKGFKVMRGKSVKEINQSISDLLDKTTLSFTDINPIPTAYYKIKVIDKQNRELSSLAVMIQLPDTIPPNPPVGLKASIDTLGNVIITWTANTEEDIYGYRVYRANAKHEEFSQITVAPVRDTIFIDKISLRSLTKSICYKILANDVRQNYSAFSEILEVDKPDTIPPSPPIIKTIHTSDSGICINWINSYSPDIVSNILIRKAKDSLTWERIQILNLTDSNYCDISATPGIIYAYNILAVDNSGNTSSIVKPLSAKLKISSCLKIDEIKVKILRDKNAIRLSWSNPGCANRYIIYRGYTDRPMKTYKNTIENVFLDDKLIPDTKYKYAIKAISQTNVSGALKTIEVNY